jgi:DNA polymerase III delta subunit
VAELSGYQVADAVMLGHPAEVLQRLRQAQIAADGARTGPAIVAAVAGSVTTHRAVGGRARDVRRGPRTAGRGTAVEAANTAAQLRRWKPAQLAQAVTLLADLDARVKGGLREGEQLDAAQKLHALERDLIALSVE